MAGQATVVHARKTVTPRPRAQVGLAVVLAVFAVLEFLSGELVVAIAIAAGAVLVLPITYVAARRAASRQPDWIEVRPDRIVAVRSTGASWELLRTPDSALQVHDVDGHPLLWISENGSIPLARFDVDEVGRAARANGWRWAPAGSTIPTGPTGQSSAATDVPLAPDEARIQLREGSSQMPDLMARFSARLVIALAICVAVAAVAMGFIGVSPSATIISLIGVAVVAGLTVAAVAIVSVRRTSLTITITPERLTLAHGTLTSQVVQRTAVATTTVGSRWARLRGPNGKALLWLPLRPRRDDVLNALTRNGWPTSESPGGLRRHL
jgi:hypothetical protein